MIALEDSVETRYRKLVISDGKVVGAILLGYPLEAAGVTAAVNDAVHVPPVLDDLRAGDWSFFRDRSASASAAVAAA